MDLDLLTSAIRALSNHQTGIPSNLMILGREVTQPINLIFGTNISTETSTESDHFARLNVRFQRAHSIARKKIGIGQEYQKKYYDLANFVATHLEGPIFGHFKVIHHDMVKQCHDSSHPLWLRQLRNRVLVKEDSGNTVLLFRIFFFADLILEF